MKKSALFLTLFAAFAMIFASCSKDSSSNNNNSGGGHNYGTITFGSQQFKIAHSGYAVDYDEDISANIVGIGLATADDASGAAISIPFYSAIPTGQFTLKITEEPEDGDGALAIVLNSSPKYVATQGTLTISNNGGDYTIDASGSAKSLTGTDVKNFTVHFTGPVPYHEQ